MEYGDGRAEGDCSGRLTWYASAMEKLFVDIKPAPAEGKPEEHRESTRSTVESALSADGIAAQVELDLINVHGRLTISSEATLQKIEQALAECDVENFRSSDDGKIELMAVVVSPPE